MRTYDTVLAIEIDLDAVRLAGMSAREVLVETAHSRPVASGRLILDQTRTIETEEGIALARVTLRRKASSLPRFQWLNGRDRS